MLRPAPPRRAGATGRPAKHGGVFTLADPDSWHTPDHTTDTTRYGHAQALAWDRLHPRLTHRGPWLDHDGELPLVEGTVIRLQVEHLPGDRDPKPVWLWSSVTDASAELVDLLWQAFLRRFDLEHTFRLFKQILGWTRPKLRAPESADRWTWLILIVHATAAGPPPRRGLSPFLGETSHPAPPADSCPGSAGVSQPPPDDHPPGGRTETLPAWSRTPARLDQPPPGNPP